MVRLTVAGPVMEVGDQRDKRGKERTMKENTRKKERKEQEKEGLWLQCFRDHNPDDPLVLGIDNMYKTDKNMYDFLARRWT
ncbi:Ubiquitin-conjugating enzyme E2 10 [Senna tora]|uniref:Ubiquitin-conjugating enzyme E2 10 n=1 Tax=Senna tora TaxID=362788 RepID=A0A834W3I1_9FABA|nr:Ubiquitin-conjugating enzyme E2 10 [Senna tora]